VSDPELAARWEALAQRHGLREPALAQLQRVLAHMAHDETAPTTARDPHQAVDVHVADSLVGLELAVVRRAKRIADLGAGAGFPGVALAAALPGSRVALVESASRKCEYLGRMLAAARIPNAEIVHARIEEWREGMGRHDLVVARALASLRVILEYAAPLLEVGGSFVAWKGKRDATEEFLAVGAAEELGLVLREVVPVAPFAGAQHRHLHVYEKTEPTPDRFPRRPGRAASRPLG
jgi:16S rRNA (guanine527-N7)-methyltransferase